MHTQARQLADWRVSDNRGAVVERGARAALFGAYTRRVELELRRRRVDTNRDDRVRARCRLERALVA